MRGLGWQRLFAALAVMALVASACGDDDEEEATEEDTTEETTAADDDQEELPVEGTLITAKDYEFDGAEELHASTATVTFRNEGKVAHEMILTRLPDDKTPEEFFADFQTAIIEAEGAGPYPDYWFDPGAFTGVTAAQPGEQVISEFSLTEGKWLMYCTLSDDNTEPAEGEGGDGGGAEEGTQGQADETTTTGAEGEGGEEPSLLPPHYENGMFQLLDIEGDAEPTLPEGDATITAQEDGDAYSFDVPDLKAGEQRLAVVNDSENRQAHHGILFKFGEGVAPADVPGILQQVFSEEEGGGGGGEKEGTQGRAQEGPPPFEDVGESSVFTPGFGGTFDVTLEEGTYAFLCFISDREGGAPHAISHNMITAFEVAA